MKRLQIGTRAGWPGQKISEYVTHLVYRINEISGGPGWGPIMGYGKRGAGVVIQDASAVNILGAASNTRPDIIYTWFEPELVLRNRYIRLFEDGVADLADGMVYTGVGANCFTPAVRSLEVVRDKMKTDGVDESEVRRVELVIRSLLGSNYGMGTAITNTMLKAGLVLFAVVGGAIVLSMSEHE